MRHEPLLAGPDEDAEALEAEVAGELPAAYVERVTRAKLAAARRRLAAAGLARRRRSSAPTPPSRSAGASSAKPADAADAARILGLLAGRTHRVITAVAVAKGPTDAAARERARASASRRCDRAQIDAYVASGEPFGKAGAYAIQSAAAAWIARIEGSYTGIMGLPLYETATLLRWAGVAGGA